MGARFSWGAGFETASLDLGVFFTELDDAGNANDFKANDVGGAPIIGDMSSGKLLFFIFAAVGVFGGSWPWDLGARLAPPIFAIEAGLRDFVFLWDGAEGFLLLLDGSGGLESA